MVRSGLWAITPQGYRISNPEQSGEVFGVPSYFEALTVNSQAGLGVLAQAVQRNVVQNGEVFIPMVFTHATLIFTESHIQHPVQLILDPPVMATVLKACRAVWAASSGILLM